MVVPRHTELFGTSWADSHSYLAVDLFFMLSGFVIANAYEPHLRAQTLTKGKFALIRLVRFYPLLFLGALLAAAAALLSLSLGPDGLPGLRLGDISMTDVLSSTALTLFFLPSRLGESSLLFPLNTAIWSLTYELAINIAFVLTLRWWTPRIVWSLVLGSAMLLAALGLRVTSVDLGWAWTFKSILGGGIRVLFGFAAGVLLFKLYSQRSTDRKPVRALLAIGLAAGPLLIPSIVGLNGLVDVVAVLLIFPLAIWLGAHAQVKTNTARWFALLGAISYPIYVMHIPMARLFETLVRHSEIGVTLAAANLTAPLFALLLLVTAWALDRYYDQPIRNSLQRIWGLRSRPAPAADHHSRPVPTGIVPSAFASGTNADLHAVNQLLAAEDSTTAAVPEVKPPVDQPVTAAPAAIPGVAP